MAMTTKLGRMMTSYLKLLICTHEVTWFASSHEKLDLLYLHDQNTYDRQTWQEVHIQLVAPNNEVT